MSKLKILIVEDDPDIAETLSDYLDLEGYQPQVAVNGSEALKTLRGGSSLPALILLDLMMPVMNGVEFCQAKALDDKIKQIPVIIMSADAQIEEKFKSVVAKAFVKKPPNLDLLMNLIQTHAN